MATRNVSLTDALDRYVEERVECGAFQNASEVVRDALRLHRARADEEAAKLERFRALIKEAEDDLAAGRYVDVDEDEIGDWIDELGREVDSAHRETPE
jgi:antitoxin ParD1/3/4